MTSYTGNRDRNQSNSALHFFDSIDFTSKAFDLRPTGNAKFNLITDHILFD
jgi:hypothetical protein